MKSAIFYATTQQPENLNGMASFVIGGVPVWVRVELFYGDCSEALEHAEPYDNETVLNTIDLDPVQEALN